MARHRAAAWGCPGAPLTTPVPAGLTSGPAPAGFPAPPGGPPGGGVISRPGLSGVDLNPALTLFLRP